MYVNAIGDIMYLEVFGQPTIILSSDTAASELCDERSMIYSDRPPTPMLSLYVLPPLYKLICAI